MRGDPLFYPSTWGFRTPPVLGMWGWRGEVGGTVRTPPALEMWVWRGRFKDPSSPEDVGLGLGFKDPFSSGDVCLGGGGRR